MPSPTTNGQHPERDRPRGIRVGAHATASWDGERAYVDGEENPTLTERVVELQRMHPEI